MVNGALPAVRGARSAVPVGLARWSRRRPPEGEVIFPGAWQVRSSHLISTRHASLSDSAYLIENPCGGPAPPLKSFALEAELIIAFILFALFVFVHVFVYALFYVFYILCIFMSCLVSILHILLS